MWNWPPRPKIFCNCENVFGGEENTHCCPVCLGLPGTLARNESHRVVDYAVKGRPGVRVAKLLRSVIWTEKTIIILICRRRYQISQRRRAHLRPAAMLNLVDEDGTPFTIGYYRDSYGRGCGQTGTSAQAGRQPARTTTVPPYR